MATIVQSTGSGVRPGGDRQPATPQTHGMTVLGWLAVCFSSLPISMGISGEGLGYGISGAVMLAAGLAMVFIGRRLRGSGSG